MYYIMPTFILLILLFSIKNKTNAYDAFIKGAMEGIDMGIKIFPYMLSMIFATQIFKNSNLLYDIFSSRSTWIPLELCIQGLFRPISGNASLGVMIDIYNTFGVDSKVGIASSIFQGSSDTTLYVITMYFGSVKVTKYRYAIFEGLLCDLIGFILTIIILNFLF